MTKLNKNLTDTDFLKNLTLEEVQKEMNNYPNIKLRKDVVDGIISTFKEVREVVLKVSPKKKELLGKFLYQLLLIRACELAQQKGRKYLTAKFIQKVGDIYIAELTSSKK